MLQRNVAKNIINLLTVDKSPLAPLVKGGTKKSPLLRGI